MTTVVMQNREYQMQKTSEHEVMQDREAQEVKKECENVLSATEPHVYSY